MSLTLSAFSVEHAGEIASWLLSEAEAGFEDGLLVGAVVGMYVRAIAFEYHATWESTWFDAARVQSVLGRVLGDCGKNEERGGRP